MVGGIALRFASLLFAVLAFAPAAAHLLELRNKIGLSREQYLVVQQIYRGWAWPGIVVFGALLSTLAITVLRIRRRLAFGLPLTAFLCIAGTQALFWTFTYPANAQTLTPPAPSSTSRQSLPSRFQCSASRGPSANSATPAAAMVQTMSGPAGRSLASDSASPAPYAPAASA